MDRNNVSPDEAEQLKELVRRMLNLGPGIPVVVVVPEINLTVVGPEPDAIEAEHIRHG